MPFFTAEKKLTRKVWTSFGIGRQMLLYLQSQEMLMLQSLNKFSYNILCARVLLTVSYPLPVRLFSYVMLPSTCFTFDPKTSLTRKLTNSRFNFAKVTSVQVENDLFTLRKDGEFHRLTGIKGNDVRQRAMASPLGRHG